MPIWVGGRHWRCSVSCWQCLELCGAGPVPDYGFVPSFHSLCAGGAEEGGGGELSQFCDGLIAPSPGKARGRVGYGAGVSTGSKKD